MEAFICKVCDIAFTFNCTTNFKAADNLYHFASQFRFTVSRQTLFKNSCRICVHNM